MAQQLTMPAHKVIVCNALSVDELALVEPLAVGLHAARRAQINVGEWVAVIGCGVIGLGAIAAASAMGARVIAIDIDDRKRNIAPNAVRNVFLIRSNVTWRQNWCC